MIFDDSLFAEKQLRLEEGVWVDPGFHSTSFEHAYIQLRKTEGRILNDGDVFLLPKSASNKIHEQEWRIREASARRMLNYVQRKEGEKIILEVGCGNGWLSNYLTQITNAKVIGIDVNRFELTQAARVFGHNKNLTFILGNVQEISLPILFNYIVLASSIQYFKEIAELMTKLKSLLNSKGEIHIIDSPLYSHHEVSKAQQRSATYFNDKHPGMTDQYFHHKLESLQTLGFKIRKSPKGIISKVVRRFAPSSPFPWIYFRKDG